MYNIRCDQRIHILSTALVGAYGIHGKMDGHDRLQHSSLYQRLTYTYIQLHGVVYISYSL